MRISSRYTIAVILASLSSTPAFSQTDAIALSSGTVSPGGVASLNLSLTSPAGNEPAALQWTLVYPPADIVALTASIGSAATSAGKSLSCTGSPGFYTCFLTGVNTNGLNTNLIQNGVVAVVTATLSPSTATTSIAIANALGATPSASSDPLSATGGTITTTLPLALTSLSCSPGTLASGASATCTVGLNEAASAGGSTVSLSSNNASLTVPASVNVPASSTSTTFSATVAAIATNQTAAITASLGGSFQSTTLALIAPVLVSALACNTANLDAGASSVCTIALSSPATTGGVTVWISSNAPALSVPASVTVPAGSSTANFNATATTEPSGSESTETARVTATLNGSSQAESFTLIICPCSVWQSTAQPANPSSTNTEAIEVGMQFTSSIAGYVTGVRFFKEAGNTGTHVGNLWSATGTHLAQVTFTRETKSGWQLAYFASPVAIGSNTTYVISYHALNGHNAADNGGFTTPVSNLPLQALASEQNAPNGVYAYGSSAFPSTGASATNYWVDVVFNTSPTVGTAAPASVWAPTAAPNTPAVASTAAAELGLTVTSDVPGFITGVRFYKGSKNLGIHIGHLWRSNGTRLAAVAFTNESATGWQQANFPTPVAIDANTAYVVSYWAPQGHYADDSGYFATSGVTNLMLYAPPDGQYGPNGSYATSKVFPSGSSSASNYWVDVVFTTAIQ
jgi:hypothetical protein